MKLLTKTKNITKAFLVTLTLNLSLSSSPEAVAQNLDCNIITNNEAFRQCENKLQKLNLQMSICQDLMMMDIKLLLQEDCLQIDELIQEIDDLIASNLPRREK